MNTDDKVVREIYSLASGHFLTTHIPLDYFDWEGEDQDQFLSDNAWEPFEYWETCDVWDLIDASASTTYKWYLKGKNGD